MAETEATQSGKIKIGVCVMEKKVKCGSEVFSAPMEQILDRLQAFGEFEIILFGDKVILESPIEEQKNLEGISGTICIQIARRLFGKILIDLRNTREEAISVAEPNSGGGQDIFVQRLRKDGAEHQARYLHKKEDARRGRSTSEISLDQDDDEDKETKYRLDPKYANVKTPERHVRTRLYFTSESHIHSLVNVLRYCNLDECLQGEDSLVCNGALERLFKTRELDYMSNIVLRMFENTEAALDDPKRYRIEMTFSRGADLSPIEEQNNDGEAALLHQEHTLPIMGPERLQEVGSYLTLEKMEKMIRPFAMPAEDFPPSATASHQAFSDCLSRSASMLERLVNLWPFHKNTTAASK